MTRFLMIALVTLYLVSAPFGNNIRAEEAKDNALFRILVLGDSLVAGYGINKHEAYPAVLEALFRQHGYPVKVINGGKSGDTALAGFNRLPFHLKQKPHLVVIALGSNDALKGLDPGGAYAAIEKTIKLLQSHKIQPVLMGMKAPRNLGGSYTHKFDSIYPILAQRYNVPFYPFFLEGVALKPEYNLNDRVHPNADGVRVIVQNTGPFLMNIVYQMLMQMYPQQQQADPEQTPEKPPEATQEKPAATQ